jgi:hypothetical protein
MTNTFTAQIEELYSDLTDEIPTVDQLKEIITNIVMDAASDVVYGDRKECCELPTGVIELMIKEGHLTNQELADMFLKGVL